MHQFTTFMKVQRAKNNLTMDDLALKCGTTKNTIFQFEHHKVKNPTVNTFNMIAHALDIDIKLLMEKYYDEN